VIQAYSRKRWFNMGKSKDLMMARQSLVEELQAINWYQERTESTQDESLKKVLQHNMDEEKEHVAMLVEWLRKNDETQNKKFKEHD
jgi:hypothetical protein